MPNQLLERIRNRYQLHRYLQPFCREQLAMRTYSPQNTIALFAQPRSGSTWLAEILNHIPKSIILNEPLWRGHLQTHGVMPGKEEGKVEETKKLNFYYYQPIPEEARWPDAEAFFDKLFRGGVCKIGLYKLNEFAKLANAEVFLVKFCYAHLLFHWLIGRYPIRPVVLIRHPCAVVASQLQHYSWNTFKKAPFFKLAHFLHNNYYLQYEEILKNTHTPEGVLAALWAINIKAIQQPHLHNKEWLTIAYEKLYLQSEKELGRLFAWLQYPIPPPLQECIYQPSISTSIASRKLLMNQDPYKHLVQWKESLNKRQISNIMHVVADFGIKYYTSDNLEPDYDSLSTFR